MDYTYKEFAVVYLCKYTFLKYINRKHNFNIKKYKYKQTQKKKSWVKMAEYLVVSVNIVKLDLKCPL